MAVSHFSDAGENEFMPDAVEFMQRNPKAAETGQSDPGLNSENGECPKKLGAVPCHKNSVNGHRELHVPATAQSDPLLVISC